MERWVAKELRAIGAKLSRKLDAGADPVLHQAVGEAILEAYDAGRRAGAVSAFVQTLEDGAALGPRPGRPPANGR